VRPDVGRLRAPSSPGMSLRRPSAAPGGPLLRPAARPCLRPAFASAQPPCCPARRVGTLRRLPIPWTCRLAGGLAGDPVDLQASRGQPRPIGTASIPARISGSDLRGAGAARCRRTSCLSLRSSPSLPRAVRWHRTATRPQQICLSCARPSCRPWSINPSSSCGPWPGCGSLPRRGPHFRDLDRTLAIGATEVCLCPTGGAHVWSLRPAGSTLKHNTPDPWTPSAAGLSSLLNAPIIIPPPVPPKPEWSTPRLGR
jgi:hypothetical protein